MYSLGLRRSFLAHHYLMGGDWGRENLPNTHHYTLELELYSTHLDEHGYLVDLVHLEKAVTHVLQGYENRLLNELPEFQGLNPSLEHFARILAQQLDKALNHLPFQSLSVRLWENEQAWAAFHLTRKDRNR